MSAYLLKTCGFCAGATMPQCPGCNGNGQVQVSLPGSRLRTVQWIWQSRPIRPVLSYKERSSYLLPLPRDRMVDGSSCLLNVPLR